MDNRQAVREFLSTRRAKITPEQVGLVAGPRRRVAGLRREEVAQLAGVSTDYYTRLEKGNLSTASDSVLAAIAEALRLDDAERSHLFALARAARPAPPRRRQSAQPKLRPSVTWLVESMTGSAAFVWNPRLDILAINALGRALWAPMLDDPARPANLARFAFLNPAAIDFYDHWPSAAQGAVALLRTAAGRNPQDKALSDLVGELATRSEHFRTWWASHDVDLHEAGSKTFRHPVVGPLTLSFDAMQLTAQPGLNITAYTAEPGSPAAEKLALLASWNASLDSPSAT
ncbi:helix-turn-helix transcriptional regulator [Pseudonocardia sp. RS11V-5]|uniref:helix-turn-helix transcriptional regulator n=1 Tax=Pseudonocardia terrae TaxID=2905831 RepID=UPI001E33A108|nr:helix-turn-helix transcriptional regulator [Pseudonocardia terrae]MCE3556210.1 helix-turn-helix transcriptional regulator [Pseudonocardia terrae]